ncbi:MAG: hypothetical protein R3F02_19790 [Thiolinea sp.]
MPQRDRYLYQSRYCEENIWHLAQQPEFQNCDVIVIAARGDFFPIVCQRAAETPDTPMLWDYHVVLLWHADNDVHYILDFDTTLPYCTPVADYLRQSFLDERLLKPQFIPLFRVMPGREYIAHLQSDRSHMKSAEGWLAEPPPWPPISAVGSNLRKFTDMNDAEFGQVLTAAQLRQTVTGQPLCWQGRAP